jgi:hypothetical protein
MILPIGLPAEIEVPNGKAVMEIYPAFYTIEHFDSKGNLGCTEYFNFKSQCKAVVFENEAVVIR